MLRASAVILVILMAVTSLGATGKSVTSHFDTDAFHYRSTLADGVRTDVSGLELRWVLAGRRSTFQVAVPGMTLNGPPGMVALGPGISKVGGGRRSSSDPSGQGTGNGPGATPERALLAVSPSAIESTPTRVTGVGDVRLSLTHRLGQPSPSGRFHLRGGVKLPTADESRGLGTGETDVWAGVGWRREGWVVNGEIYFTWVRLGDPNGLTLQDGPAGGGFLDWPLGRGGLRTGVEAAHPPIPGEPTRLRAVAGGYGRMGRNAGWDAELLVGLSDSAVDMGIAVTLRF